MSFYVDDEVLRDERVKVEYLGQREDKAVIVPRVIVLHYGVVHGINALVAAQRASKYWAHLSIDGYCGNPDEGERAAVYKVVQAMPLNRRGAHAGRSSWNGKTACNGFSIGIEIANPGPLLQRDGVLKTTYGKTWPKDQAVECTHASGRAPKSWTHWAIYTDQEIDLCVDICLTLMRAYPSIVDIVGHDEISPGRKSDPGPAFPMEWLRAYVTGIVMNERVGGVDLA